MRRARSSGARRHGVAGAAVMLLIAVAACSSASKKAALRPPASTITSNSTSSTATTATTAPPPPPTAPLTGLPQPDAARRSRATIVVKVDNVDPARPQSGLDAADIVYEELVESHLSRLIALFQSTDADRIGPVRSTRTTDINVVWSLNRPLYAYSGGNANFVAQLRASPVVDVGADSHAGAYFYGGPHAQPHNLYTSTGALYAEASSAGRPPAPMFVYRSAGQPAVGAGVAPASHVDVNFGMALAAWDWDAGSETWKRGQNGSADVEQNSQQIAAANVIVQSIPYSVDGFASGEGVYPAPPIPKGETVGTGTALVFTGGMVIQARWAKPTPASVTQFTDSTGQPIQFSPGRTWIELAPVGATPNVR